jgi:putative component of toxin-antitoxin plasmid stabilization module
MYIIEKTDEFDKWLRKLKDLRAKAIILFRIQKLENDEHFGDCEPVCNGIRELKLTMPRDTEYTSKSRMGKLLYYSLVVINQHSNMTLKRQKRF